MQIVIHTLIDITETNARKGSDKLLYSQQQNYMTLMQTIGLRSNYELVTEVSCQEVDVTRKFGSTFTGNHNVWSVQLLFNSQATDNVEILADDLNLVPVICGLRETELVDTSVFRTDDPGYKNIIFKVVDNTIF